ncbi:TetR family transcriptional regulator [Nonomuraea dietziae]|uniref:TetR family transcriptional regulator n=1 Tax=Nonomuraea dietziae TaxID=65515 RepID=UPI0033CBF3B5
MSRAEATKARILKAATEEFAAHGIAGARVERIAKAAEANKNLIYVYFTSKHLLFDAVFDAAVSHGLDQVPFTPEDLPGYAGRVHDHCQEHPEVLRLAAWHRLERGAEHDPAAASPAYAAKLESLATAQREGHVPATFTPAALLTLVLALATAWGPVGATSLPAQAVHSPDLAQARESIVAAVRLLLTS